MDNKSQNKYDEATVKAMTGLIAEITAQREKQGVSQKQLAEQSGVKQSAISRLESLKALPQLDTLIRLCGPLNLQLTVKQKKLFKENTGMNINSKDVKKLEVEVTSCHLNVTTSNDDDFHMVTDNENDFTFEKEGDTIKIKQKKRNVLRWLLNIIPTEVKITIPASFKGDTLLLNHNCRTSAYSVNLGNVTIKNGNGAIECEEFNAATLKLINGNGKIEIQGAAFDSLDGSSGNGRIKLSGVRSKDAIRAKTGNGRLIAKDCTATSFDLRSSNGAILVNDCDGEIYANTCNGRIGVVMLGNQADYSVDFSTSLGAIYIGNDRYQGRYSLESSGKKLEAFTTVGSIRVKFADTPDITVEDSDILDEEIEELALEQVEKEATLVPKTPKPKAKKEDDTTDNA